MTHDVDELHHGDCVNADDEAATMAFELDIHPCSHPPDKDKLRAHNVYSEVVAAPKNYFARNRDIVSQTDFLICCPKESERQTKGGTWYTFDYARKIGKPIYLIRPDGSVTFYTPTQKEIHHES